MWEQVNHFFEILPLIALPFLVLYLGWVLIFDQEREKCGECRTLRIQFIECQDALACAVEWLSQSGQRGQEPPVPVLEWLERHLLDATVVAEQIRSGDGQKAR